MEKNNFEFSDLMLDLETIGDESYSAILSIGALEFDIETGKTGKEFYQKINLESCFNIGLKPTASTILWWLEQSDQARREIYENNRNNLDIRDVLINFSSFCSFDKRIWANSPSFDCNLLKDAYKLINKKIPWDFRKENDVRTIVSKHPKIKKMYKITNNLIPHNALHDCYYQVGFLCETWKRIIVVDDINDKNLEIYKNHFIEFGKFAKNYQSSKNVEIAFNKWIENHKK